LRHDVWPARRSCDRPCACRVPMQARSERRRPRQAPRGRHHDKGGGHPGHAPPHRHVAVGAGVVPDHRQDPIGRGRPARADTRPDTRNATRPPLTLAPVPERPPPPSSVYARGAMSAARKATRLVRRSGRVGARHRPPPWSWPGRHRLITEYRTTRSTTSRWADLQVIGVETSVLGRLDL